MKSNFHTKTASHLRNRRRKFLKQTATFAAFAPISSGIFEQVLASAQDSKTVDNLIKGKDKKLIILKPYPAVIETPLEMLIKDQLTPAAKLFVRNNSQPSDAATIAAAKMDGWKIKFGGLVNRDFELNVKSILDMEKTDYEMVLQCSGNSRALYAGSVKSSGTQWGKGGMGNVRFSGVRLSKILEKNGIEVSSKAKFVRATGNDDPLEGKEDFEHSLPIGDVLSRSILAYQLNGQSLPAIHGGPIRLITPGIYGTMQLKWLNGLYFENEETSNFNHVPRYRVPKKPIKPGTKTDFTLKNSDYNWNMKVKSVVLSPNFGAKINAGKLSVQGVAFNDGSSKIETVLVSIDRGATWKRAMLENPESLYAWTRFKLDVNLKPGKQSIWTRAVDGLGRSQPLNGHVAWNPRGYEWNGVEKIEVEVS